MERLTGPVRGILALIAVGLIVVVVLVVTRKPPPEPIADSTFDPTTPDAHAPVISSGAPSSSSSSSRVLAPVTIQERREVHMRLEHELCENGAKVINKLNKRDDTDPKGIGILSNCLKYGNVAWYKCVLTAKTADEGLTCNARLLRPVQYLDE